MSSLPARLAPLVLAVVVLAFPIPDAHARRESPPITDVALASLPAQARDTFALIRRGGPFPYERDGVVFGNRERLLPAQPRGHYHEYTVRTPGASTRGAQRIVCGGPKREPDVCYYTSDHYQSFRRIRE